MNDKIIIKNADNPPSPIGWITLSLVIFSPIFLIALIGYMENKAIAVGVIIFWVLFIIWLVKYERKNSKNKFDDYMKQITSVFVCPDCSTPIAKSIGQEITLSSLPILYHCEKCSVLWFTGMKNNSAS